MQNTIRNLAFLVLFSLPSGQSFAQSAAVDPASVFAKPQGTELALVIVKPFAARRSLNPDQVESLAKIRARIDRELEKLTKASIGDLASSLVANLSKLQAESGLKGATEALRGATDELLESVNEDLPANNPLIYSAYFLPIASGGMPSPTPPANAVTTFDPPRWDTKEIPFSYGGARTKAFIIEPSNGIGESALSGRVSESLRTAVSAFTPESKFVLAGIALHVSLQKNHSEVKLQILSGLKPARMAFEKTNEQVAIEAVVIPEPKDARDNLVALLTLQAKVQGRERNETPRAKLEFGSLGGIDGGSYGNWRGSLKVERVVTWADGSTDNLCHERFRVTGQNMLAIEGTLQRGAIGNRFFRENFGDLFQSLNPRARFRIFDLSLNAEDLSVEALNVRVDVSTDVSFLSVTCMNDRSVRQQFEGEFNNSIQELLGIKDTRGQQFAEVMFQAIYTL